MNPFSRKVRYRGVVMSEEMAKVARLWDLAPSPFPPLKVPPLQEAQRGAWSLRKLPGLPIIRGYFRGLQAIDVNWTLKQGEVTWMSITPMELESQSHHRMAAHGSVLIGGLGLGVLAWNVAQKGSVHRVMVVERNPEVIALIEEQAQSMRWENWAEKVVIVNMDIFDFAHPGTFDVALLDIWPTVGDMKLRPDLQRIAKRSVRAREYAAWGMELDFISWCKEQRIPSEHIHGRHWEQYSEAIGVPLIMKSNRRMAQYALRAATNATLA